MIKDLFPKNMNKRVPSLFKYEVGAKSYAYLIDGYGNDDYEKNKIINKKAKATKKCVNLFLKITKIACAITKPY